MFTNCTDPAREEEFNRWYTHTHIPDLSAARGFVRARRFVNPRARPGEARYVCQYEFDSDDPEASLRDLLRLSLESFARGRHIDCVEGALPGPPALAPLLEIDPTTLKPLDDVAYPRVIPEAIRQMVEAELGAWPKLPSGGESGDSLL
jgi:hypothetical protein